MSVLTASWDRTAKIWIASTGECVQALSGHAGQVMSAVFSGDGMSLLTASWDKTAMIWNASIVRFVQVRPRKAARAKARARRRGPAFEHAGALASLVSAGSERAFELLICDDLAVKFL